jgi:carboxypeptidase E
MNSIVILILIGFTGWMTGSCKGHESVLSDKATILDNHHSNEQVYKIIDDVHKKCPTITHVYDLAFKSVNGQPLRVIAFSDNPEVHEHGEPEFKYVGNMHGNEVVGREMLLELMTQMCDAFNDGNENVNKLIMETRIHILVTMNPDGWDTAVNNEFTSINTKNPHKFSTKSEMLKEQGVTDWMNGRANSNNVDLNRNFPDLDKYEYKYLSKNVDIFDHLSKEATFEINKVYKDCQQQEYQPETLTVINWINSIPFVLSSNLHGGDLVVNYPYDDSDNHVTKYSASPDDPLFK